MRNTILIMIITEILLLIFLKKCGILGNNRSIIRFFQNTWYNIKHLIMGDMTKKRIDRLVKGKYLNKLEVYLLSTIGSRNGKE